MSFSIHRRTNEDIHRAIAGFHDSEDHRHREEASQLNAEINRSFHPCSTRLLHRLFSPQPLIHCWTRRLIPVRTALANSRLGTAPLHFVRIIALQPSLFLSKGLVSRRDRDIPHKPAKHCGFSTLKKVSKYVESLFTSAPLVQR